MKNIILIIYLMISSCFCFGQMTFNNIKFQNTKLEEIPLSSIKDIKTYQKEKFKNPRGPFTSIKLVSNDKSKLYRLKGSDDLVQVTSVWNNEIIEQWDKNVGTSMEMFTPVYDTNMERFTEYTNTKNYKSVIFFIKDYKLNNKNYILYKNLDKKIGFFITYISNSPDSVKIENMRNIIKGMKIE